MPKIVDHDAQRHIIIQQAIQLFVEHGYSGLGMRDLAAALGVSKSALYHYFPAKEALFNAVVESIMLSDISGLTGETVTDLSFAKRWDAFITYISTHETNYVRDYLILTEYARMRDGDESAELMQHASEQYAAAIAAFLGISHDAGRTVYLQLNGAIMQRLLDNKRTDLRAALHWLFVQLTPLAEA